MQKVIRAAFKDGHYMSRAARVFYDRMLEFYSGIDSL